MGFFYIMHIIICVLLVCVILFQDGKTGGLVSVADSSQAVFGAKGASNFLAKLTTVLAIVFMIFSLGLAFQSAPTNRSIASDHTPQQQQAPAAAAPADAEGDGVTVTGQGEEGKNFADSINKIEVIRDQDQLPPEIRQTLENQDKSQQKPAAPANKEGEKKDGEKKDDKKDEEQQDGEGNN